MPMTLTNCPVCECTLEIIRFPEGAFLWGRYWCPSCETTRGFASTPLDQAASWRMQFGKYAGWSLLEIDREPRGRDYLRWAAANIPRAREMISAYLEAVREHVHESSGLVTDRSFP